MAELKYTTKKTPEQLEKEQKVFAKKYPYGEILKDYHRLQRSLKPSERDYLKDTRDALKPLASSNNREEVASALAATTGAAAWLKRRMDEADGKTVTPASWDRVAEETEKLTKSLLAGNRDIESMRDELKWRLKTAWHKGGLVGS